jgi:hypothetical protein
MPIISSGRQNQNLQGTILFKVEGAADGEQMIRPRCVYFRLKNGIFLRAAPLKVVEQALVHG